MDRTRITAIAATAITVAFVAGAGGWYLVQRAGDGFADCRGGQVAGGAIGGAFSLIDQTGAAVTDADLFRKPALVYFGYATCPDVCPFDNARNAEAVDILEERGIDVTPVFITIDPERDTPEVLADYTANLHPAMIGLTGTPEQIAVAAKAYKAVYRKQPSEDGYYLVDHTTFTYLMLPGGAFADFFRNDVPAEEMADRTACFLAG